MFIADQFVFIELHKTGSGYIKQVLGELFEGEKRGKHNPASSIHLQSHRTFIGSIRNPWEWYLSLWAFGCDQRGGLYREVTGSPHSPAGAEIDLPSWEHQNSQTRPASTHQEAWKRYYSDVHCSSNFREWLHMIHDQEYWNDVGEGFGFSAVSQVCGLMTYRYLTLFCKNQEAQEFRTIGSSDELHAYELRNCYIQYFVRTEHLADDLILALSASGIVLSREDKKILRTSPPKNVSSRTKSVAEYYDLETLKLVSERERLIVDRFGYVPPNG